MFEMEELLRKLEKLGYKAENSFDLSVWSKRKKILDFLILKFLGDNSEIFNKLIFHFESSPVQSSCIAFDDDVHETQKTRESRVLLSIFQLFKIEEATLDNIQGRSKDHEQFISFLIDIIEHIQEHDLQSQYFTNTTTNDLNLIQNQTQSLLPTTTTTTTYNNNSNNSNINNVTTKINNNSRRTFVKENAELLNYSITRLKDLLDEDIDILPSNVIENLEINEEIDDNDTELDVIYDELKSTVRHLEDECHKHSCLNFKEDNINDSVEYHQSLKLLSDSINAFKNESNAFIQNFPKRFERPAENLKGTGPLASAVLEKYNEVKRALKAMNETKTANDLIIQNIDKYNVKKKSFNFETYDFSDV